MSLLHPPPSTTTTSTSPSSHSHLLLLLVTPKSNVTKSNLHLAVSRSSIGALRSSSNPTRTHRPTISSLSIDRTPLSSAVVASPPLAGASWSLERRHIYLLNLTACAVAVSAAWLFFSAIPALLAFKKAATSLEKLFDVTAEELPDTMAAVRLSGMEISDLTMELSDLGQEITQGVRRSTRVVRVAEDRLRHLSTTTQTASMQIQTSPSNDKEGPIVAITARNLREGIVRGRGLLGAIFSVTRFSSWALSLLSACRKNLSV